MTFEAGSFVWAKVGRTWWAGQVTTEYPADIIKPMRKEPLAVVKFASDSEELKLLNYATFRLTFRNPKVLTFQFPEKLGVTREGDRHRHPIDTFTLYQAQVIKSEANILPYNTEKKEDLIRKGRLHLQNNKEDLAKFIFDTRHNEKETGGDEDLVEKVSTAPTLPKKPAYADLFKTVVVPPSPPKTPGTLQFNFKKIGASPAKKPRPSLPTPQIIDGKKYSCDQCGFTSDRVGVIASHRKSHTVAVVETKSKVASPKPKPQAPPVERSPPKLRPQDAAKKAPMEKTPTPRKRKAPKEQAKQEILADWSDEEGEHEVKREKSPEMDEPIEQKKARTQKEIQDAFDNLLSQTQPPKIEDFRFEHKSSIVIPPNIPTSSPLKQDLSTPAAVPFPKQEPLSDSEDPSQCCAVPASVSLEKKFGEAPVPVDKTPLQIQVVQDASAIIAAETVAAQKVVVSAPEDLPKDLVVSAPEDLPKDLVVSAPEDLPKDLLVSAPEDLPKDLVVSAPEDLPKELVVSAPEDLSKHLVVSAPEDLPKDHVVSAPEDLPKDHVVSAPEDLPKDLVDSTPEDLPKDPVVSAPENLPKDLAVSAPEDLPKDPEPIKATVPAPVPSGATKGPFAKVSSPVPVAVSKASTPNKPSVAASKKNDGLVPKNNLENPDANSGVKVVPGSTIKTASGQSIVYIKAHNPSVVTAQSLMLSPAPNRKPVPVKSPGTPGNVRIAGPPKGSLPPATHAGMVQITATKSAAGAGGKSVTFTSPVAFGKAEPNKPAVAGSPKSGNMLSLTVKATTQGLQIKPAPKPAAGTKKTPQKPPESVVVKPGPGILKAPPTAETPVIAVKSAPQPYPPKAKGGKAPAKAPVTSQAFSEQILVVPPITAPPPKTADLRPIPAAAGGPKKGSKAKKPPVAVTVTTAPQTQKFIHQKAGQVQQFVAVKFDPVTGQAIQPELCPVISQTLGAKIHGMPQAATSVAPLPPIKVNPAVVQTVQSVTTKVHALPAPSASTSAGAAVQRNSGLPMPQLQARQHVNTIRTSVPNILSGSQHSQPTSASQMLLHQQAISQMVGAPVQFSDQTQTYQLVSQPQASVSTNQQETGPNQQQPRYYISQTASGETIAVPAPVQGQVPAGKQKKPVPPKKAVQTYGRKQLETAPKPKPTATIKPTMSDDEASSNKLRQALQPQKPELDGSEIVAEKVVHLVPVENMDGTVTYMIVQLDEQGALRIDSTEGPMMAQTPPDAILIDKPTDGQKILQALTTPLSNSSQTQTKSSVAVPQAQVTFRQHHPVSHTLVQPLTQPQVAISPAQVQIPGPPALVESVPAQITQPQTIQAVSTQQVFIQSNGGGSQGQVSGEETMDTNASGETVQAQNQVDGDGSQQVMTLEEAFSQGQIQYEAQNQYYEYGDVMQQVQMSDGTVLDLSQFAGGGENQILLLQEDGTLIDPVAMGIDISQFMQQQPTEPS